MRCTNLSSLSLLAYASGVLAANCWSTPPFNFRSTTYADAWTIRSTLCGGGGSVRNLGGSNFSTNVYEASVTSPVDDTSDATTYGAYRTHTQSDGLQYCWDAFNEIITQCIYNNLPGGFYTYNDDVYSISTMDIQTNW